jgi:hypothetical protein
MENWTGNIPIAHDRFVGRVALIRRLLRALFAPRHRQISQYRDLLRQRHLRFFAAHIDVIPLKLLSSMR